MRIISQAANLMLNGHVKLITRKGHLPNRITLSAPDGRDVLALRASTRFGAAAGVLTGKRAASVCG